MDIIKLKFLYLFLPIIYSYSYSEKPMCSQTFYELLEQRQSDYSKEEVKLVAYFHNDTFFKKIKVIDEYTGKLFVALVQTVDEQDTQNLSEEVIELKIILSVADSTNTTICKNDSNYIMHSKKVVVINNLENPCLNKSNCHVVVPVYFNYAYTGCYKIYISRKGEELGYMGPKTLYTKYKKQPLDRMEMSVSPQKYVKNDRKIYTLAFFLNYTTSDQTDHIKNESLLEELEPRIMDLRLRQVNNRSNLMDCRVLKKSMAANYDQSDLCTCKWEVEKYGNNDYRIACDNFDLVPGNYCITIRFSDERCTHDTTWLKKDFKNSEIPCSFFMTANIDEDTIETEYVGFTKIKTDINLYSEGILIFCAFLFLVVLIYLVFLRKPIGKSNLDSKKSTGSIKKQKEETISFEISKQVLLIYPRDCQYLMESMKKLRDVLRIANIQVFDYYDDSLCKKISRNPHAWIKSLIIEKSTKVIVVANDCSRLLERKLLNKENILYKSPECFDHLFLYALDCLTSTVHNSSGKIKVISLQEKDKDSLGLKYLNSPQIYQLPLQLEELILSLHNYSGQNCSIGLKDTVEANQFETSVKEYQDYTTNNKDYLNTIFNLQK